MSTASDRERLLTAAGFPPERIARIKVEGAIVRALDALDDAGAELDSAGGPGRQQSVGQALVAARHSLVEALRRNNGGAVGL
jgi:hypothetical protein